MIKGICYAAAGGVLLLSGFAGAASSSPPVATAAYASHSIFPKPGAFVHKDRYDNPPPLLRAILNGKPDQVKHLLEEGAPATARWRHVRPYILIAAGMPSCNPRILDLLIQHGANANGKRIAYSSRSDIPPLSFYYMPLAAAASGGSLDCVRTLLRHGAKPNLTNTMGDTPLNSAVASKYCSPAMIDLFVKGGADPNYVSSLEDLPESVINAELKYYGGPLKYKLLTEGTFSFQMSPLAVAAAYDHPACARALIGYGANVNVAMPKTGRTALMWAVHAGRSVVMTQLLLKAGADVTARDRCGRTALFLVTGTGGWVGHKFGRIFPPYCVKCAEALIAAGADVNAVDDAGDTPLTFVAGAKDSLPIVELLVKSGANVNYRNPITGMTATKAARLAGNGSIVNWLEVDGAAGTIAPAAPSSAESNRF